MALLKIFTYNLNNFTIPSPESCSRAVKQLKYYSNCWIDETRRQLEIFSLAEFFPASPKKTSAVPVTVLFFTDYVQKMDNVQSLATSSIYKWRACSAQNDVIDEKQDFILAVKCLETSF
jgi:hypothetical protein